ncbi:MAG: YihY family inner membrane protein [Sneathiella sp.]|nr:YihY family inner membrane protein [Sneathiella sp.]
MPNSLTNFGALCLEIIRHFGKHNCLRMATALSYQTLLALVPLVVLGLSLLTYVDAFYTLQNDIIFFLFDNFLPTTIAHAYDFLQDIVLNAEELTYLGLGGLALTAILLFLSIESSFAQIWQTDVTRNLFKRLLVYLLLILLGPIGLSTSLTLFKWIAHLTEGSSGLNIMQYAGYFTFMVPFILCFLAFFLLYRLVPAEKVRWQHAMHGAAVAAALFVLGKQAFKLYLIYFPSYQVIYGALAILPLFLIWLYVSWALVLLGATITAVLGFRKIG